ncbi:MAG: DUF3427 domain-containing protein [Turicibacter sp.]|nr:DUF3427 domain-containing protein [Turicibacter sp.]
MSDFHKLLGGLSSDFGILSGTSKQVEAKYLFASVQTLSKDENLKSFAVEHFDYILIDEAHRAGSNTYQKIIDYFKPKFLLGMTATPERTDGFNLYELFNYQIAYEIRLQEAVDDDMLCPFHYFGVTDFSVDGELIEDGTSFSQLISDDRVEHIIEKVNYYGFCGDTLKGLIFCSSRKEAIELSSLLNQRGFLTCALTGDDSQDVRQQRVRDLEEGRLQYLLTVDIMNEGVDIPSVNQVVMLRQTQSSIIFIQQLGRGLRKHDEKEYVTIIDFIGNYRNNYLIPVALSGDSSLNKDNIRRRTVDTSYLKGVSTINFEAIAKEQIYKSINNNNLTALKLLKEAFQNLKYQLGRNPMLSDFIKQQSIDPVTLMDNYDNYYQFLTKMKVDVPVLTPMEQHFLTMISKEILNGKRLQEVLLLDLMLKIPFLETSQYKQRLKAKGIPDSEATLKSVKRFLTLDFFGEVATKKYGGNSIVTFQDNGFILSADFRESLEKNHFFRKLVEDVLETAIKRSGKYNQQEPFTLYEKYSRKDVCRLLNWENDESATVYGYKVKYGTCPIFVTLHKHEEVEASVNYGDEFLSDQVFRWFSRNKRTLETREVVEIINSKSNGNRLDLFVKKEDGEGTDFYYLGQVSVIEGSPVQTTMKDKNGKELSVVTMEFLLPQPVEHNLFQYLTGGI